MATHSSIFAWRIPWTEEPGGLQSTGSQRVGYDFTFTFTFNPQLRRLSALCLLLIVFLNSQTPVTIFYFKLPVF